MSSLTVRFLATSFLAAVLLLIAGCFRPQGRPLAELQRGDAQDKAYFVRPGDILNVDVYGEPGLSGEKIVREDGQLSMKFAGDIKVEGMTLEQTGKSLEKELSKFMPGATVSVALSRSAPIKYYLSGKFQKAGEYRSDGRITFLQAIATGGNFQPFADESNITLIRRSGNEEIRYVLDYNNVVAGREPNPELRDGDIISVTQ
jgi:polysaccharide export outer membrane protein